MNFLERREGEVRRIPLPRTPVHNMVTSAARLLLSGPLRHGGADGVRGHDRVVGRAALKGITTEGQRDFARRPQLWLAFVLDLAAMNKGRGRSRLMSPLLPPSRHQECGRCLPGVRGRPFINLL